LPITAKVRTGIKPIFKITAPANLCVGDSVKLTPSAYSSAIGGYATPQIGSFLSLPISGDSLFMPDGSDVTYFSNIFISQFASGQTLTNINDLKGIFMNMEHSYLGDLNISITAPNGVIVNLKSYPGGGLCFLGEPVYEPPGTLLTSPLYRIAGKGYTYSFNSTPNYGTMAAESNNFTYSFIDNSGVAQNNKKYLPSGSYTSSASLNALVGTPLNGTWTLQVRDNLAADNGFLFNWRLDFNPALFPNVETYNVPIISQNWKTPADGLVNVTGTIANIQPDMAGNLSYFYRVVDTFGCVFDTTIKIVAVASPLKPNLGNNIAFCNGQSSLNLTVTNPDNSAFYTWSNGANGVAATVFTPDTYIVTANNSTGCKSRDTIVVSPPENVTVYLGVDTMFCATAPNLLKPIVSNNVAGYLWNNGTTKDTLRITASGTYSVKVTTNNGCFVTDEIIVEDNPVNSFKMPIDTIICEKSSYLVTLNTPPNTSILWNDGVTGSIRTVTETNVYTTIANNVGCLKQSSYRVDAKPLPVVDLGSDITLCNSKTILLKASYPGASYLWNDNTTDSTLLANAAKLYWVEASYNQCTYRDSIEVKYVKCECNTTVPNAFSPNGDGINDAFGPKMECVPTQFQISIFNRNGQVIFETKDYTKSWDGTLNGKPMPVGTYYYVLNYFNPGLAIPERFAGSVTIIR
jgi:gliding motility-associated-like protein